MHIMPRETPIRGGRQELYSGTRNDATARRWFVRLEVCGLMWWPTWEGEASDTRAATDAAKKATRRRLGLGPELVLNVLAVHEVQ